MLSWYSIPDGVRNGMSRISFYAMSGALNLFSGCTRIFCVNAAYSVN